MQTQRTVLVCRVADALAAVPIESVIRVAPMAKLVCPPGLPSCLEGILNLEGIAVPVLRLDRLLLLPAVTPSLYSMLVVMRDLAGAPVAVVVDRVTGVLERTLILPLSDTDTFHACARGSLSVDGEAIPVLSPEQILLEKEKASLEEFQMLANARLRDWESVLP